jgi:Predicted metal-dependent hydrolase
MIPPFPLRNTPTGPPPVIERTSRRARHLRIEVRADGRVILVIPARISRRAAHAFLAERREWVEAQLRRVRDRRPVATPALRWDGGDHLPLRGRSLPLQILPARVRGIVVRCDDDAIRVFRPRARADDHAALREALERELRRLARSEALGLLREESQRLEVDFRGPRIADQRTLWGSCAANGTISLNWRLLLAPPEVFRYVVVHELCHRRHLDHSARFWTLVRRQMPEFEPARRWLRLHGAALHDALPRDAAQAPQPGQLTLEL